MGERLREADKRLLEPLSENEFGEVRRVVHDCFVEQSSKGELSERGREVIVYFLVEMVSKKEFHERRREVSHRLVEVGAKSEVDERGRVGIDFCVETGSKGKVGEGVG